MQRAGPGHRGAARCRRGGNGLSVTSHAIGLFELISASVSCVRRRAKSGFVVYMLPAAR
jgi:hypothetical protein